MPAFNGGSIMTVTSSNYDRIDNDFYETEPWAVEALLRALPLSNDGSVIWEPAAGNHAISDVFLSRGFKVITSDIETYQKQHSYIRNFFDVTKQEYTHGEFGNTIITNPPYGKNNTTAVRFAEHALELCDGWVTLLLTAKFDFGKTRQHLFKNNKRFYGKIALTDRLSWAGNGKTGTDNHAWYIWIPSNSCAFLDGNYLFNKASPLLFWEGKISEREAA